MLDHCLQLWPNINPAFTQCIVEKTRAISPVKLNFDLEQIATEFILMADDYMGIHIRYKKSTTKI